FPFFCVRIPHTVYSVVGDLDERFGPGGGEDKDYCIRALLAGFPVQHALMSYVLHFQGKSTWSGPETSAETAERNSGYIRAFCARWGEALTRLFVLQDEKVVAEAGLEAMTKAGRHSDVVRQLCKTHVGDRAAARPKTLFGMIATLTPEATRESLGSFFANT